jgi:hypothetical protein
MRSQMWHGPESCFEEECTMTRAQVIHRGRP